MVVFVSQNIFPCIVQVICEMSQPLHRYLVLLWGHKQCRHRARKECTIHPPPPPPPPHPLPSAERGLRGWRGEQFSGKNLPPPPRPNGMVPCIGVRGGGGGGSSPPVICQIAIFGPKKHVIFGQNHLIFGQAMEKIFGQLKSAPLNETGPVRLWSHEPMYRIGLGIMLPCGNETVLHWKKQQQQQQQRWSCKSFLQFEIYLQIALIKKITQRDVKKIRPQLFDTLLFVLFCFLYVCSQC